MKNILKLFVCVCAVVVGVFGLRSLTHTSYASFGNLQIISRQQWGADESYRYLKSNDKPSQVVDLGEDFYEKYKDELQYSRIVETDEDGNKYKWPLQYPEKVVKFIIHHSATTSNLDNPSLAIRNIYHHHAINRGWGDIGYNYIVDPQGRIYEGRYGGEGVIGAHAGRGNHGSIGIMILGNYEENEVPMPAIVAVSRLIHEKAKIHGINPAGSSMFRGKVMPNVLGHRDVGSTRCPGEFLYEKFSVIRTLADKIFEEKPKFVKDYDFQNRSELYYIELKPEETVNVTLKLENIGTKDWGNGTFLVVNDSSHFNDAIFFPTKDGVKLASMNEGTVKSGETGTFTFSVRSGNRGRTAQMDMTLVVDGTRKLSEYVVVPVTVQQAVFSYELAGGSFPPETMEADKSFPVSVRLRNSGNVRWNKSGDRAVTLVDGSGSVVASLNEEVVNPGAIGTFDFTFRSPVSGGLYKRIFRPSVKNAGFNAGAEISFETVVYARAYDAEVLSRNIMTDMERGSSYNLSLRLKNVGSASWNRNDLGLFILRNNDVGVGNLDMQPRTVGPGETAEISFRISINSNAELGTKLLTARAKMNDEPLNLIPAVFLYSVVEENTQKVSENGPDIRIKLGFSGDPEVTSSTTFDIYSGEKHIRTMEAGEKATVTKSGSSYRVSAGTSVFTENGPIRFIPRNNGIVQISNYENRPAWNTSLNDNEFRGLIEVWKDDGKLVAINELPVEYYLKGLGEVPNAEEPEKIKAIMTAARTYAKHYIVDDEKFPGKPYHLDDDPDVTQKYIGYGFEKRAPNVSAGIDATKGVVVTYDGKLVKTPYFNRSDGVATRSAKEVWGWTNTPYLQSVDDSYCDGSGFLGHGVGMSGCGAHGMAKAGYGYEQILTHYYTGIALRKLW